MLVLAALLLVVMWSFLPLREWIEGFRLWIIDLGLVGLTVVLGPATALTLTAGLAYGFWGFFLVVLSATLAASVAFLLGRYLAHQRVLDMIERDSRMKSLHQAFSDEGWRVVVLLRTLVGIMPATALYVYIGSLGASASGEGGPLKWALIVGGLIATAIVAWLIGKRAQQVLARHEQGKN